MLSYNAILNFIIGERGVGKTYGAKKHVVNRFIKKGEQFVYLRRYKTELKDSVGSKMKPKFFNQIVDEFPDHELSNSADTMYIDGKICGYAIPLSTAHILKSASFDKVKTIIFDEFIIDKGCYHYLSNEVEQLLDIIETIGRTRDIRVLFLGNAISITNPYFTYFKLSLPYKKNFKTFKDGLILVNYIKNEAYREFKKETRFGKLIEGTAYGKYAIDNEFLRDSKTFIMKKNSTCKFYFKVFYKSSLFGVWLDYKNQLIFISSDYDPSCPIEFSFSTDDHNETTVLLRSRSSVYLKSLIEYYKLGKLRFDNVKVKNDFMEFLGKYIGY